MQPGNVEDTCADVGPLSHDIGYAPATPIETGVERFALWYLAEHASGRIW